jgi:arylsulfatase A-like enzyme
MFSRDYRGASAGDLMSDDSMPKDSASRSAVLSLWLRLISLGIIGLVFAEALFLAPKKAQVWTLYLTSTEVVFEVVVRLIFAALAGMVLGTLCAAALAPFLWYFKSSRARLVEWTTKVGVVLVVFLDSRLALTTLITWSNRGVRFEPALLVAHFAVFAIALCIPRTRRGVTSSLDDFLGEKMTRRTAIATVAGTAALAATEFALGKAAHTAKAALTPQRPQANVLLITFDALAAEDMSLYGYRLPTTPNIDAFARRGTVFTNYYSASTFTTPCVATMLTGMYPSESGVFHLRGRLRAENAGKSLPHAMRAGGFATGSFFSNPYAYYLGNDLRDEFDFLPEPVFQSGGMQRMWEATRPLHQDSGFGSRFDEYADLANLWSLVGGLPNNLIERYRAAKSFEHAREIVAQLPEGFFLWIHVMTPHGPYLPDSEERGRFLPVNVQQAFEGEGKPHWKPHYPPDQQSLVDQWRLRYDEFVLTADRAFGSFMSDMEDGGKLRNTTVIVSADHGESFEGGVFQHGGAYQTRPVIHIPLIIRTPGQQDSRRIAVTADQTALAPTILELAGQPKPDAMRGQSLAGWLKPDGHGDAQGQGEGQAFNQYLETNSVFKPLHHGTVGVIDGKSQYQYVLDLETEKGRLRPLNEAQTWNLDRSAENPALASTLRAAIYARFPELVQKSS